MLLIEIGCVRPVIPFGSVVFIVNYGADFTHYYCVSIDDFEQVNGGWKVSEKIINQNGDKTVAENQII